MTSKLRIDEIQNNAGTTTLAKIENGQLTGVLSPATGFRNRIINGDMRIDQRNAGASVTAGSLQYTIDRWRELATPASKFTIQRNAGTVTPPVGFTNYLGMTSTSAYSVGTSDYQIIQQFVEGFNAADLNWGTASAQTVTISFLVRSSLTGIFGGSVQNGSVNRSYPFSYTISVANAWELKTVLVPGDTAGTWLTTNGRGITLNFSIGTGTANSGTAGVWAAADYRSATGATSVVGTNGATFYITGVQLEKGTVATPFEFRSIGQELALCQRYFERTYNRVSAASMSNGNNERIFTNGGNTFATVKRAVPTISISNPYNGVAGQVAGYSSGVASSVGVSSISSSSVHHIGIYLQLSSSTSAANEPQVYQWTASAEL